jgi:hypothetical protein
MGGQKMANFKTQTIYVSGGAYSITSENVKKLGDALREYIEKKQWKSCIWDFLGLQVDWEKATSRKAKRFNDIVTALAEAEQPEAVELYGMMKELELHPVNELTRTVRMKPAEKAVMREEMLKSLVANGIPEDLAKKMAKAI